MGGEGGGSKKKETETGRRRRRRRNKEREAGIDASGTAPRKPQSAYTIVGRSAERIDLPAKIFGEPAFIHDMALDGMTHARVVRQPNRGATIEAIDEQAIRRAARGEIAFVRDGNFLAIVGDDETAVDAAAAAAVEHVTWRGVDPPTPLQQEAVWLLQQPAIDRVIGTPEEPDGARGLTPYEATYTRGHLVHASMGPSCGLALYRDGHLTVWTHCQGVYPLRGALTHTLGLDAAKISVRHVQGPGCYGHNGADDAAADAAVIAMRMPGRPIRVRWRRAEEFAYEPVSPAIVVKVRALLDAAGSPVDWTTEIWSSNHNGRPGSGAPLLAANALPNPPPLPPPADVPEANGGDAAIREQRLALEQHAVARRDPLLVELVPQRDVLARQRRQREHEGWTREKRAQQIVEHQHGPGRVMANGSKGPLVAELSDVVISRSNKAGGIAGGSVNGRPLGAARTTKHDPDDSSHSSSATESLAATGFGSPMHRRTTGMLTHRHWQLTSWL